LVGGGGTPLGRPGGGGGARPGPVAHQCRGGLLNRILQQAPCCSPLAQHSYCAAPHPPPPTHQPSPLRGRGAGWRRRRAAGWGRNGADVELDIELARLDSVQLELARYDNEPARLDSL
jgi:DNA-binding transcriptional LysR family regulator